MGAILILLDWLSFVLIDRSFFNLNHGSGSLRFILLWGIAAGIGGYLGAAAEIFKISRFGCIAAGMAGSLILPRLNDLFSSKEDIETPQGRRVT